MSTKVLGKHKDDDGWIWEIVIEGERVGCCFNAILARRACKCGSGRLEANIHSAPHSTLEAHCSENNSKERCKETARVPIPAQEIAWNERSKRTFGRGAWGY